VPFDFSQRNLKERDAQRQTCRLSQRLHLGVVIRTPSASRLPGGEAYGRRREFLAALAAARE